jgi:hypothetical protein
LAHGQDLLCSKLIMHAYFINNNQILFIWLCNLEFSQKARFDYLWIMHVKFFANFSGVSSCMMTSLYVRIVFQSFTACWKRH